MSKNVNNDMENENYIIETGTDKELVLVAVEERQSGRLLAVRERDYVDYADASVAVGVIIRDDAGIDILVSTRDAVLPFGSGKPDIPDGSDIRNAPEVRRMTDLDGKLRQAGILGLHADEYQEGCALRYCQDYANGDYWLPSGGEANAILDNLAQVNHLLEIIGGTLIPAAEHWLSTMFSNDYPWHLDMSTGTFGFWRGKGSPMHVRPIADASKYVFC